MMRRRLISSLGFMQSFMYARTSFTSLRSKNCVPPTTRWATPCSRSASSTSLDCPFDL